MQGHAGIDLQQPQEIHDGEEQVSRFLLDQPGLSALECLPQLPQLFLHLVPHRRRPRPVESCLGRFFLKLRRFLQGRQRLWDTIEHGPRSVGAAFLLGLDGVPLAENVVHGVDRRGGENVRMAADELFGDVLKGGRHREGALLLLHPCDHRHQEVEISQLLLEILIVTGIDGAHAFPDLVDEAGSEGARGLLPVPRTAVRSAQPPDDLEEPCEGGLCIG